MPSLKKSKNKPVTNKKNPQSRPGRRYKGYDVRSVADKHEKKQKSWFWKVLGISLLLSLAIIVSVSGVFLYQNRQRSDYLTEINSSNTLDALIEDKDNIQIITSYTNTKDGYDYTQTRFIKTLEDGSYFIYTKTEGLEKDYKEVMANDVIYRNDGNYTYYYGMIANEYKNRKAEVEDAMFSVSEDDQIESQTEKGDLVQIQTTYTVKDGDKYTTDYNFKAGDVITRRISMDKETECVTAATESYDGEEFYTYAVEFNGEDKNPNFYQKVTKSTESHKCIVYFDYGGSDEKTYTFEVPQDVYFDLFEHDEYKVYMDAEGKTEFTELEMQAQNPESMMTLYMIKESDSNEN